MTLILNGIHSEVCNTLVGRVYYFMIRYSVLMLYMKSQNFPDSNGSLSLQNMMFFFIHQRQKSVSLFLRIFFSKIKYPNFTAEYGKCFIITGNIKEETQTPFIDTSQIESFSIKLPYFSAMDLLTQHMMENVK